MALASCGCVAPLLSRVYRRSTIMSTTCEAVVVVWAAGSRVSGSIPIATVRVPPCLGPLLVGLPLPLPQAVAIRPSTTRNANLRMAMSYLLSVGWIDRV